MMLPNDEWPGWGMLRWASVFVSELIVFAFSEPLGRALVMALCATGLAFAMLFLWNYFVAYPRYIKKLKQQHSTASN